MRCAALMHLFVTYAGSEWTMHMTNDPKARCLDGSPAVYWHHPAAKSKTTSWLVHLMGGGWCYDGTDCSVRSRNLRGSSTFWNASNLRPPGGLASLSCEVSPAFCDFHHVVLLYCDGASFTGARDTPLAAPDGTLLYFRGRRILTSAINSLAGLEQATEVILTGDSAGALGVIHNADHVGALLARVAPKLNTYKAIAVSGYFLDHANVRGDRVFRDALTAAFTMQNSTAHAHGPFARSALALPRKTPMMVLNSALDLYQTECIYTSSSMYEGGCHHARWAKEWPPTPLDHMAPHIILLPVVTRVLLPPWWHMAGTRAPATCRAAPRRSSAPSFSTRRILWTPSLAGLFHGQAIPPSSIAAMRTVLAIVHSTAVSTSRVS